MIDVLYLTYNRRAFTEMTLPMLIANTNWDLLQGGKLIVYDDGSTDGTLEFVQETLAASGIEVTELRQHLKRSPVGVMNHYVESAKSDFFVKVDNDIVVPPGYLEALLSVIMPPPYVGPVIELLGMEAGRCGPPAEVWDGRYGFEEGTHIGGVGIMRTAALGQRPRMVVNGRFGFTEWQHEYRPLRGWIKPDLMVCSLDQIPFEPWASLTADYIAAKINREWGKYHDRWMAPYWDWWRN